MFRHGFARYDLSGTCCPYFMPVTVVLTRGAELLPQTPLDSSKRRMKELSHQSIICSAYSILRRGTVGPNASICMSVRGANISSFGFARKMPCRLDVLQHLHIMIKMSSMISCINQAMLQGNAESLHNVFFFFVGQSINIAVKQYIDYLVLCQRTPKRTVFEEGKGVPIFSRQRVGVHVY
jgi:hypothetical protein